MVSIGYNLAPGDHEIIKTKKYFHVQVTKYDLCKNYELVSEKITHANDMIILSLLPSAFRCYSNLYSEFSLLFHTVQIPTKSKLF